VEALEYWYLFPTAVLIATVSMSSGIGGAVFFAPLFMLVLQLEPAVAVGAALITELFGFISGFYGYARRRLIDYRLGMALLLFSVPGAIVGTLFSDAIPAVALKAIFAVGIVFIGSQLYLSYRQEQKEKLEESIVADAQRKFSSELVAKDGTVYRYTVCEKNQGRLFAAIGGGFLGMLSVGLAELQEYQLVARCRVPSAVAVGTSVFVVVVSVFFASIGHVYHFATAADQNSLREVINLVTFTVPGVILGGQLGPFVQSRVNPDVMKVAISMLFIAVGLFMLATLVG
jgi:uncharacterized membrane protein YfcA